MSKSVTGYEIIEVKVLLVFQEFLGLASSKLLVVVNEDYLVCGILNVLAY